MKNTAKHTEVKRYVVTTFAQWAEPQTHTHIVTEERMLDLVNNKGYGEVTAVYELGRKLEVKAVVG